MASPPPHDQGPHGAQPGPPPPGFGPQPGYGPYPGHGPYAGYGQPPPQKNNSCLVAVIVLVVVGVPMLGVFAALGIYGVRRYLAASKTSEAKYSIGAISRGAVSAYERDSMALGPGAKLCPTADDVPRRVPAGKKYMPATSDFDPGTGWDCVGFSSTVPMYYQLSYRQGADYLGPSRGGVDPGVDGFEAGAQGDLDGDGETSLFVITAEVVNGSVHTSPSVFQDAHLE